MNSVFLTQTQPAALFEKRVETVKQLMADPKDRTHAHLVTVNKELLKPRELQLKERNITIWQNKSDFGFPQEEVETRPQPLPPRLPLFSLYYILSKLQIITESAKHYLLNHEIELADRETTALRKERMAELTEVHKKKETTNDWSILVRVFSWIGSFTSIITGLALMATGVGIVAGALLLFAGLIALTNQLLEVSGGWKKIAEHICGDDVEKGRNMIMWMQIGITVLVLILGGSAGVFGGFGVIKDAMSAAGVATGGVATMGIGLLVIGKSIVEKEYWDHMAKLKRHDRFLRQQEHKRKDLLERSEESFEYSKELHESLHRVLELESDATQSIIFINRR